MSWRYLTASLEGRSTANRQELPSGWEICSGFALPQGGAEKLVLTLRQPVKTWPKKQHFNPVVTAG
jgi:hypothetical protein